jgi:hypothetical protein
MADLRKAKKPIHATYPVDAVNSAENFEVMENLITGRQMKERFLFGVPTIAPLTGEKLTDAMLKDFIKRAINLVEAESKIDLQPRIKRTRQPFHAKDYMSYIHLEIPHKPIRKVISLTISASNYEDTPDEHSDFPNGLKLYTYPLEWLDMANAQRGILNINPFSPAFTPGPGAGEVFTTAGTVPINSFLGQLGFIPGFWNIEVLTGVACEKTGKIPVVFNELIGMKAAILALDNLIPLFRVASQSLGIDGLSQSVTDNLFNLLANKRKQLAEDYTSLLKVMKTQFNQSFFMTSM